MLQYVSQGWIQGTGHPTGLYLKVVMASSPVENRKLGVLGKYWLFDKALQKQDVLRGPLAGL